MCWKCDGPLCWDLHGQRRHTTPNLQFSDQPSTPTAGSPFNCRVLVLGHDWCVNLVASKWWKAWFLKQDEANPSRAVSKFSPPGNLQQDWENKGSGSVDDCRVSLDVSLTTDATIESRLLGRFAVPVSTPFCQERAMRRASRCTCRPEAIVVDQFGRCEPSPT